MVRNRVILHVETSPVWRGLTGCSVLEDSYARCVKALKLKRKFLDSKLTPTPPASTFYVVLRQTLHLHNFAETLNP